MNSSIPIPFDLGLPRVPSTEANGGLNWVDLYEDPEARIPVQVILPSGNEILLGDSIDLRWQGTVLSSAVVSEADVQTRIVTFLIRALDIIPFGDGEHTVNYLVTAAIGGGESLSPDLPVRVKTLVPGGLDPDAGTPYINEKLLPPDGIPDFIDDSTQSLTVTVRTYENMHINDIVTLDWGGQRLSPAIPVVVGSPVTFVVSRAVLEASAGKVIVRYQIRDLVNNWSKWSLQKDTDVEVGNSFLQAPRASGVGVVNGEVDLALLGSNDLQVDIPVYMPSKGRARHSMFSTLQEMVSMLLELISSIRSEQTPFMEEGDRVQLIWSGHTADGTLLPDVLVNHTVAAGDIGWPISLRIPNAQVKLIASGYATMRYTVTPLATPFKSSRRANVPVIGNVQDLPPITVLQASGSVLDPDTLPATGATLHIDASDLFANGDFMHIEWRGTAADGSPLVHVQDFPITAGMVGRPIERFVEKQYVSPLINGSVALSYTLNKGDGPVRPSPVTTLQIRSGGAQLPAPTVDHAVGDHLDPADVPANGTVIRVNYAPMLAQEVVTAYWEGKVTFSDSFTVPANWNGREIPFTVAKSFVDGNLNETVQVYYTVSGYATGSIRQPLAIGAEQPGELVEDFSEHDQDLITAGGSIRTRYMTIRFISGGGQAGFDPMYVKPPEAAAEFVNPILQVSYRNVGNQTLELELDAQCSAVTCDVHGVEEGDTLVRYLDAARNQLERRVLPKQTNQKVTYTTLGAAIKFIEISSQNNDWTLWDNFVMQVARLDSSHIGANPFLTPRTTIMATLTDVQRKALADAFASARAGVATPLQNPFPKPTVTEAPTGTLDPILGSAGVHVEVAYASMNASDIIGLSFNGNDSFPPLNGSAFGKVTFDVPVSNVAAAIGKTVQVIYAVVRPDGTVLSDVLDLTVTPIPVGQMPAPQITQASGGNLDVNALTADADLTVAPWPLIATGQRLWLRLEGSSSLDLPAWQGFAITTTGPQATKVPLSYLQGLDNGSALRLVLEVSFDNGVTRQPFPITTLNILSGPTSISIDRVTDSKGDIPNGGTTTDTSVTIYGSVA